MLRYYVSYWTLRALGWPLSKLSYPSLHRVAQWLAFAGWALFPAARRRTLNNLAIATSFSEKERWEIGRQSLANLAMTCLDYLKLKQSKNNLSEIIVCDNPHVMEEVRQAGHGLVFFEGHQANWEVPFLYASAIMPGTAVGRPVKNPLLYRWLLSLREMKGGKIIPPKNALQEGLAALKEGRFIGLVADQALTTSSYSYPLFGRRAWTSTAPALLACKANCPVIVGLIRRENHRYHLTFSDPIWPDPKLSLKPNVIQIMDRVMATLEASILKRPAEWMWLHNRWKQIGLSHVHRCFRHDILVILLPQSERYAEFAALVPVIFDLYSRAEITVFYPQGYPKPPTTSHVHLQPYTSQQEWFSNDWRTQMLFNFTPNKKIEKHYRRHCVFATINEKALGKAQHPHDTLENRLHKKLLKPPATGMN